MPSTYAINIGRQLGSGGREIGEKLARQLGISFYDKELINLASEESGLCKEFFEKADERASQSFSGGLFGMRFPAYFDDASISYFNYLNNDALFKIQSDVIRQLASEKSCLFVGRCADYILRDNPNCVNIFISSPIQNRIERLCRTIQFSESEAKDMIRRSDKHRPEYYNYYSYKTWGAATTYHLCMDSSILGIEDTVSFIKEFAVKKLKL
ncbi:MAG: Cytidylate kinase [Candidatus Ordinivivax streblomastigis]|uniref:Cytidylate kinase n=1 Tax=Candidatus Ordinivivax streblomastigis TaxID=2540710 RepID=A0A5M8NVG8_9BACT|nr:MAG: Cytidylate kinase [Candidatus Ordinivivax streblomastigis]